MPTRKLIIFLTLILSLIGGSNAQNQTSRISQSIDWSAVDRAREEGSQKDAQAINRFRSGVPNYRTLANVRVPVLVVGSGPVRAAPRLQEQTNSYVAFYSLDGANLSVMGTSTSIVPGVGSALAQQVVSNDQNSGRFEKSEDSSDFDFTRFGANYVLRLSCVKENDKRCTERQFLQQVSNSLIVVGGKKQ